MSATLRRTLFTFAATLLVFVPALAVLAQEDEPTTSPTTDTVVLTDTFDDPTGGPLADAQEDGDLRREYDDGAFEIDALVDDFSGDLLVPVPGTFSDATIAIDAILAGSTRAFPGRYILLQCRMSPDGTGYQYEFRPLSAQTLLWRLDGGEDARELLGAATLNNGSPLLDDPHRLELTCEGETITARLDRTVAVTASDATYAEGSLAFGGGVYEGSAGRLSVDFDNLAVSVPTASLATATPEATATPSATPFPTATPTPIPPDRSAIRAPADELLTQVAGVEPVFGPASGEIVQVTGGTLDRQSAGISVRDFVTEVTFVNPSDGAVTPWDVGIGFRQAVNGQHWRIIVRSDGTWHQALGAAAPVATGLVENLQRGSGETNSLQLVVSGPTGYLLVNGEFTASLNLADWSAAGDVWVGSGLFFEFSTDGALTPYQDFTVWSLDDSTADAQIVLTPPAEQNQSEPAVPAGASPEPVVASPVTEEAIATPVPSTPEPLAGASPTAAADDATAAAEPQTAAEAQEAFLELQAAATDEDPVFGPDAGSVTQAVGSMDVRMAGVSVTDFYTSVRFTNPASADAPDHPWDVVIAFWHTGGNDQIRLIITSEGVWSIAVGSARPVEFGDAPGLLLGPARGNVIELAVSGTTAYLAINGEFVSAIDIPGSPAEGDIWLASGSFPENVQDGEPTAYSAWSIWSLD